MVVLCGFWRVGSGEKVSRKIYSGSYVYCLSCALVVVRLGWFRGTCCSGGLCAWLAYRKEIDVVGKRKKIYI